MEKTLSKTLAVLAAVAMLGASAIAFADNHGNNNPGTNNTNNPGSEGGGGNPGNNNPGSNNTNQPGDQPG